MNKTKKAILRGLLIAFISWTIVCLLLPLR